MNVKVFYLPRYSIALGTISLSPLNLLVLYLQTDGILVCKVVIYSPCYYLIEPLTQTVELRNTFGFKKRSRKEIQALTVRISLL